MQDGAAFAFTFVISIFVIAAMMAVYFLPTLIAFFRDHRQQGPIFIICLLTGWTGIGWVVALAWSVSGQSKRPSPPKEKEPELA